MRIIIRLFVGGGAWLTSLSPEPVRSALRRDGDLVLRDACERAWHDRGVVGLLHTGLFEWAGLLAAVVHTRVGRGPRVTAGGGSGSSSPSPPRSRWYRHIPLDLRFAWRSLSSSGGTTALAVLTLALGIGVNAAVFSMLDAVLWRPVPFADADRLTELYNTSTLQGFSYAGFPPELVSKWRTQTDLFDRFEAYDRASFVYRTPETAEMVGGASITPGLLSTLGVAPIRGRLFSSGDGRTGTERLVIVSEHFWRTRLGGSTDPIGRVVSLNGIDYTVIGVMPASFRFPNEVRDLWIPYDVDAPPAGVPVPTRLTPFARIRPGATLDQVGKEVKARGAQLGVSVGRSADISAQLTPPAQLGDERTRQSLVVLGGAVGFLLLIVCANVANLTLSRALVRTRDLAVRASLGASRATLVRQTFVEQMMIGALGVAGGLAVAHLALSAAVAALPDSMTASTFNAIDIDGRTVGAAMALGALTVLFFGLPPAFVASRGNLADVLRSGTRSSVGGAAARRFRSALVVIEVALSLILLVGAAVLTHSLIKLQNVDKGFETDNLVSVTLGLPTAGYKEGFVRDQLARDVVARVAATPGMTAVTSGGLPCDLGSIAVGEFEFANREGTHTPQLIVPLHEVPPNYFSSLGLPLLRGRVFADNEPAGDVIVSDKFAKRYWPNEDVIGGRFHVAKGPWLTVVGVAGDVPMLSDDKKESMRIYYPVGKATGVFRATISTALVIDFRTILVRSQNVGAIPAAVASAVSTVDPTVIIWKTNLVDQQFSDAIARPRVVFLMMSVLAIAGLALAAAGVYGVLSCLVAQRLREIGVRLALGARATDIGWLILGNGLILTVAGLVLGVGLSIALSRALQTLLYSVEPSDPIAIVAVSVLVLATAIIASWRPAKRAMKVDPVSLLRE